MSVEFIGMIATQDRSETRPPSGPAIDPAYSCLFVGDELMKPEQALYGLLTVNRLE